MRNLIDLAETLKDHGVGLRVPDQGIDTTTPAGRMFFHVLAALAEFEAWLISERTLDELEAARARGRTGGRPSKMTPGKPAAARTLYDGRAHTMAQIAEIVGLSRATLYRHLEPEQAATGNCVGTGYAVDFGDLPVSSRSSSARLSSATTSWKRPPQDSNLLSHLRRPVTTQRRPGWPTTMDRLLLPQA